MATPDTNGEFQQAWLALREGDLQKVNAPLVAKNRGYRIVEVLGINGPEIEASVRANLIHSELSNFNNQQLGALVIYKKISMEDREFHTGVLPIHLVALNLPELLADCRYRYGLGFAVDIAATPEAYQQARGIVFERVNDGLLIRGMEPFPGFVDEEASAEKVEPEPDSALGQFIDELNIDI